MTGERDHGGGHGAANERPQLRAVAGPVHGHEDAPAVRLVREWKGATVADLECSDLVAKLPGRVRSALRHIERGYFAAADAALPGVPSAPRGAAARVLPGPGHRRRGRTMLVVAFMFAAIASASMLASWFTA